jgi:hypothetical protein
MKMLALIPHSGRMGANEFNRALCVSSAFELALSEVNGRERKRQLSGNKP